MVSPQVMTEDHISGSFFGVSPFTANLCFLQLRYLQTLNNISAEKNSTIVFPVPVDIISNMLGRPHKGSGDDI